MLDLLKIAITGGIASGKSSVCKLFEEQGAFVVSCDAIVHELLSPGTEISEKVSTLLGIQEEVDFRKKIAEQVFKDSRMLVELEKILHPATLYKIKTLFKEALTKENYTYFVVEIPLLFEIRNEDFYDIVITVIADEPLAKERFKKAGFSYEDYERRMKRQMPQEEKAVRSDYVIKNNGSLKDLKKQVNQVLQEL